MLAAPVLRADITGSAHDFSARGWGTGNVCTVCHTPHNSNTTVRNSPLWNHTITVATFTPYSSTTLNATVGQPDGVSKLCLSCHDGTVAVDSFGGRVGSVISHGFGGTNLRHHHPVSFVYDSALAAEDGELHDPTTQVTALGGTIAHDLLVGGKLECSSCHDVHNTYNNRKLFKISDQRSALCLTCHDM
ncbi:MAG: cytochrome C [Bdellovibrionales bacterium GWA2_49_15]|nr:MAG: cytochrome C [Bdellovibrionales bacterium GWA2_49_15]HAZ14933.1 cytochrome C [Bdellovibrionales bacterium]